MAFFGAFLWILAALGMFYPLAEGSVNLYLSGDEVKKLLGLTADLYYVRNNQVNSYALKFNLPVPADINSLHFTWRSSMPGVRYRMNLLSENTRILKKPETNISLAGEVPLAESVFRVNLTCSGQSNAEVGVNIQLNVTLHSAQNYTVLNFRRRKVCMINSDPVSKPGGGSVNNSSPIVRDYSVSNSTSVFYIAVGVACTIIFLIAMAIAAINVHSIKQNDRIRTATDNYVPRSCRTRDSDSSQVLSQSSTQTYLRADTPNTAGLGGFGAPAYPSLRRYPNMTEPVADIRSQLSDICIQRSEVTLGEVLQEGTFGRIYHGIVVGEDRSEQEVFIKTVTDQASEEQVLLLLRESCMLRGVHHRHVQTITHACLDDGRPMTVFPYLNHGNLKVFLKHCRASETHTHQILSTQDLVHLAIQIGKAMQYLGKRGVVHRDLATRNCVLDEGLNVKVTDNALARDLFSGDYHCLGDNENRPVKWLAIESLVDKHFSSASDVWAFGVLLWELMTLGQTPYSDIDPFEMASYLRDGFRAPQPINCPDELFAIMACCWALSPEERPKFAQLTACLQEFHKALGLYI
ncbi:tyrosine-protein kinase RYK-like isoform X2 [Branchiostoma lanceolatum]|uniref:tyrosine-protein kinase RYK-like isoform X2 n=1 Tax=Branchiostoma lanceolatum TaxID=7740 RepID=UPI003453C4E2